MPGVYQNPNAIIDLGAAFPKQCYFGGSNQADTNQCILVEGPKGKDICQKNGLKAFLASAGMEPFGARIFVFRPSHDQTQS